MPFNGNAETRKNLPLPFKSCSCESCKKDHEKMRELLVRRQHRLRAGDKDCRLKINFDWSPSPAKVLFAHMYGSKTILRLPDEILLRVFKFAQYIPSSICLALTCKRLCALYVATVRKRSAKHENRLFNSIDGFWKYKLVDNLSRGWIPQKVIRFCWGCWLFRPYGESSKQFWHTKLPVLAALPKRYMIAFAGGYCNFFPVPAHDKKAELLYALPIRMHVYDEVEDTLKIIREAADCPSSFPLKKCVLDSDDIQQYQNNWEVQLWLGKQGLAGVNTSLAKDKRLRCPSCVLTNNPIRLLDTSMKVGRQPDLPVLLENTLPRRASVLGYKWDSHHKDYSMIKSRKGLTGSFRDRQKKRKRKQS